MPQDAISPPPGKAALWIGRVLSGLVSAFLIMSAVMKLSGAPELAAAFGHLGVPLDMTRTLAVLELACVLLYALPQTAALGALLLTGYLGGAIFAHVRVGDPFITVLILGVVAWGALYLRDPRVRRLLPLRSV